MTNNDQTHPLTGAALLEKCKQLENLSYEEKAKACGYCFITANGKERISKAKFNKALLDALGISISVNGDSKPKERKRKRSPKTGYRLTVQCNGNLLIGAAYTKQMNLKPGDQFEITLGRKSIHLRKVNDNGTDDIES